MEDPPLVYRQTPVGGQLTLIFDVEIHKKYGLLKPDITNLDIHRTDPPTLRDIVRHMESTLKMNGSGGQLLLKAVCAKSKNRHLQNTSPSEVRRGRKPEWKLSGVVPLVCQQIWSSIVVGYPEATLTILVDQHAPQVRVHTTSCVARLFKRELKYLDVVTFLPTKSLKAKHIMGLCRDIFERGVKVKPELRRGVWLHLVGVFHPRLESREEREHYMAKLRMVYDHLKGKIMGESSDLFEKEQLVNSVHRDAIRTDPSHPFFANYRRADESYVSQHYHQTSDDSNIQKLVNIIVIYTLEHGNISYTQGMTDLLSPILYVMKNEADAYILFAAMVERIKKHFSEWCVGTLLKLERLRHLCEVLDPKLFTCLSAGIEEDAFALFFGMVLIECRREFSFEDSFHLLETIWAGAACIKNTLPFSSPLSSAEWARYMTYQSPEVLQQVFEESGFPYSAIPLPHTISGSYSIGYPYSRNTSLIMSQSPPSAAAVAATFLRRQSEVEPADAIPEQQDSSSPIPTPLSSKHSDSSPDGQHHRPVVVTRADGYEEGSLKVSQQCRARSQSDSNLKSAHQSDLSSARSPCHISSASPQTLRGEVGGVTLSHKLGNSSFSHSESELYDSFSNSKVVVQKKLTRHPTEMSDMSSLSSGTASVGNLLSSTKSTRNGTPDSATGVSRVRHCSRHSISMERSSSGGQTKVSVSNAESDTGSSGSSTFQDALTYLPSTGTSDMPYLPTGAPELPNGIPTSGVPELPGEIPSTGISELPSDISYLPSKGTLEVPILMGPESSSLDGDGSPDTLVAHKSPRMTMAATPISSGRPGGGVVKHKEYTDPKTGANYITTCAEVHDVDNPDPSNTYPSNMYPSNRDDIHVARLQEVIEHNGMITSVGHKSPLVSHHTSREASFKSKSCFSPPKQSVSDGEVIHRRKRLGSPKRFRTPTEDHSNTSSPVQYGGVEIPSSHRVTPVAFFDTMEKLAESAPTRGAQFPPSFPVSLRGPRRTEREGGEGGRHDNGEVEEDDGEEEDPVPTYCRQRANSDAEISLLMSQLVSMEEGAPRVNHKESLSIPFSDCYSLFVCLSILVQNRHEIIRSNADFYQLSMILNSQATKQDLGKTLRIAHQLFRVYRKYQEMCFGPNGNYDGWLDGPQMERPKEAL